MGKQIITSNDLLKAGPGDIVYLEKGARVDYSTPSMVTLACLSS